MSTDYDTPRKLDDDLNEESIEELKMQRDNIQSPIVDEDEVDVSNIYDLNDNDHISGEELFVKVLPAQEDEFMCNICFLVKHKSQIAKIRKKNIYLCKECESS